MTKAPVLTKIDFVKRYETGEFGNRSPTWNTLQEFLDSKYDGGLIHIRNRIAGGTTIYNVEPDRVEAMFRELTVDRGIDPALLYFSAMCPTEKTVFQGEVMRSEKHLQLHYTTIAKPMRDALKELSYNVSGLTALRLIKFYMDENSQEWLNYLLDEYPDHVVEFTTLSVQWGTNPGYNSLFWEVRKY